MSCTHKYLYKKLVKDNTSYTENTKLKIQFKKTADMFYKLS